MTRLPATLTVLAPTVVLAVVVLLSAAGEIAIDQLVFGVNAGGTPALNSALWARLAIHAWNFAVAYLGPPGLAVLFIAAVRRTNLPVSLVMTGGALVCVLGAFFELELVWTEVATDLPVRIGLVDYVSLGIARAIINLVVFGVAAFLMLPRRN